MLIFNQYLIDGQRFFLKRAWNKNEVSKLIINFFFSSERTVFIMPPDPVGLPEGKTYR